MKQDKHLVKGPLGTGFIEDKISGCKAFNNAGASAFFLGRVRADESGGKTTTAI